MAGKNEIKNRIVLEGESEYKKQLAEINRELKESKAAMRAAAAEYDAAGGSMTALYAQGDALERTYRQQGEALELMGGQLVKVENAYGKNSREATELRTRINNMRAEMAKTQTEMRQFEQRLEDGAQAMEEAGRASGEAVQGFEQIGESAQEARGGVGDLIGDLQDLTGIDIGGLVGGVGGLAGAAALAGEGLMLGNEVTQAWNQIANYTGATGEELERLQTAAENLYKRGFGENLGEAAQTIATVSSYTRETGEGLERSAEAAMMLDDIFGMDIPESARAASQLMTQFGLDGEQAYALIATAAQNGADKNGNLLDTINEYSGYFAQAGYSAEEFGAALSTAAENGIYDVDKVGDAMKEFTLRIGDGSETTREALENLGIEAADLPGKFMQGGETAKAAFQLVIDQLLAVEDPLERNRLGTELFGTQWEDTGGKVLTVFDQMDEKALNTTGTLEAMNATRMDDLGAQLDRIGGRAELAAGKMMQPFSTGLANFLGEVSDAADETGETWLDALGGVLLEKGATVTDAMGTVLGFGEESAIIVAAKEAGTLAGEAWGEGYAQRVAEIAADPETVISIEPQSAALDDLFALSSDAAGSGDEQLRSEMIAQIDAAASAAAQNAKAGKKALTIDDLFEARAQAAGQGDLELVAELDAIIEQVIASMREGGESAGQQLIDGWAAQQSSMETAAQETADAAVTAIGDAAGDMNAAGDMIGEEAVDGAESGLDGMRSAGRAGADDLVSGLSTGRDRAYQQGYAAGQAYWRGYSNAMAGGGTSAAYTRAQALHAALEEDLPMGFAPAPQAALRASEGMIDYGEMGRAVAQAISGMTLGVDARKAGGMLEVYVAQAGSERTAGTIRGAAAKVRRW